VRVPGVEVSFDLTPVEMDCMRCGRTAPMRFYGICTDCRAQLQQMFDGRAHTVEVEEYTPKMNVTPNAVALRGD
jgi:Zn finger protein HypA/HybF involved in hydrogenase expression